MQAGSVTLSLCVFGLWHDAEHRWLLGSYSLSEWWMGENETVAFVDFQLFDSAPRQSPGEQITGAGQNVGVILQDAKVAERDTEMMSS